MKTDPLVREVKKAYRKTKVYELDRLLTEESRWKRKLTIASNKLAQVRVDINKLALELAQESVQPANLSEEQTKLLELKQRVESGE